MILQNRSSKLLCSLLKKVTQLVFQVEARKKNAYEIQLGSRGHLLRPTKKTLTLISTVTIK